MNSTIITYIMLKNFAAINAGMKKKEIEIDFSKNRNRIILIVGKNGSGKTALLSNLHPFAHPGSSDIRTSEGVIIKGETGYKEIHIKLDDSLYVIKHIFNPSKEGHTVKSYVSKNEEELNPNGNVTSFKEVILLLMGIETDYLRLLRLGSNITNFIDMKSTDRKNFTSELLTDVDIYSKYYKKINEDMRHFKSQLKLIVLKIEKLKMIDDTDAVLELKKLQSSLSNEKTICDKLKEELYEAKSTISRTIGDLDEFNSTLKDKTAERTLLEKNAYDLDSKLRRYVIDGSEAELMADISEMESDIRTSNSMREFLIKELDDALNRREDKELSLKVVSSGLDYANMQELYLNLHRRKEELEPQFLNFKPICTKDDILKALVLFQKLEAVISNIKEFDRRSVEKVIGHRRNNTDTKTAVKRELYAIDVRIQQLMLSKLKKESEYEEGLIYYVPEGCNPKGCPYYNSFKRLDVDTNTIKSINNRITNLERDKESINSMNDIDMAIESVENILDMERSLLEKLPKGTFNKKDILLYIESDMRLYDESKYTDYIQMLEEYEEYRDTLSKIKELKSEITLMESNQSTISSVQKELCDLDDQILSLRERIEHCDSRKKSISITKLSVEKNLSELREHIVLNDEFSVMNKKIMSLIDDIYKMNAAKKECESLIKTIPSIEYDLRNRDKTIEELEESINQTKLKLMMFKELTKEREALLDKFDEMEILRETLSSTKGLPLLFMKLYMEDIRTKVNTLLKIVYDGELEIGNFRIDDREFNIPYTKRGMEVSDVRMSSQGERSFISVALSFALIKQSLEKYNVLLLDEIDATLDTNNRRLFIDILEKQLDMIGAEQCFMISHNDMFDNYPVSLIFTTKEAHSVIGDIISID